MAVGHQTDKSGRKGRKRWVWTLVTLALLIVQQRSAIHPEDWFPQQAGTFIAGRYFDFIGCMTYDFHGEWSDHSGHNSPLYTCNNDPCGSTDDSYEYYLSRQVPKEKLLLGIPFYGRSFDCSGLYQRFQKSQQYGYKEILNLINAGWSYIWDDCAKVPYIRNPENSEIICFDDEQSVALKCRYVKEKDVAGVIIWEVSEDYYQSSSLLLEVVGKEFKVKKKAAQRR